MDERALEAACKEFERRLGHDPGAPRDWKNHDTWCVKGAIEAYEAARWRPIEEMADRKVEHVLVCLTDTRNEIYDAFQLDDELMAVWAFADTDDPFEISHEDLVARGAMFRTIDPPTQDAVSRGTSTPPAAEASS